MVNSYLLGVVLGSTAESAKYRGYLLTFVPAGSYLSSKALICLDEPVYRGERFNRDAAHWLVMWPEPEVPVGAIIRPDPQRSYFLERMCADAGCTWFAPMFRRLASGEDVLLEEIQIAYMAHNNGRRMREGTLWSLFDPSRKSVPRE